MPSEHVGFWARFYLAAVLFWKLLTQASLAVRIRRLLADSPEVRPAAPHGAAALQLLSIMQREGRLVDFLQEDVSGYSDAEIGAAARIVHTGCRRGLAEYIVVEPVRPENEGAAVILEPGFDPTRLRITGKVVGEPPFRGKLAHHGWQVAAVRLPHLADGHDPKVIAPAEVELS